MAVLSLIRENHSSYGKLELARVLGGVFVNTTSLRDWRSNGLPFPLVFSAAFHAIPFWGIIASVETLSRKLGESLLVVTILINKLLTIIRQSLTLRILWFTKRFLIHYLIWANDDSVTLGSSGDLFQTTPSQIKGGAFPAPGSGAEVNLQGYQPGYPREHRRKEEGLRGCAEDWMPWCGGALFLPHIFLTEPLGLGEVVGWPYALWMLYCAWNIKLLHKKFVLWNVKFLACIIFVKWGYVSWAFQHGFLSSSIGEKSFTEESPSHLKPHCAWLPTL